MNRKELYSQRLKALEEYLKTSDFVGEYEASQLWGISLSAANASLRKLWRQVGFPVKWEIRGKNYHVLVKA